MFNVFVTHQQYDVSAYAPVFNGDVPSLPPTA